MIQRKQSIFLLLAFIASVVCLSLPIGTLEPTSMGASIKVFNLFITTGGGASYSVCGLFGILVLSSIISLATIFLYKNRMLQNRMCICNLFLLIAWYIVLGAYSRNLSTPDCTFSVKFAACLPAISMILVFMARAGILHDEKLVRAADRIR